MTSMIPKTYLLSYLSDCFSSKTPKLVDKNYLKNTEELALFSLRCVKILNSTSVDASKLFYISKTFEKAYSSSLFKGLLIIFLSSDFFSFIGFPVIDSCFPLNEGKYIFVSISRYDS